MIEQICGNCKNWGGEGHEWWGKCELLSFVNPYLDAYPGVKTITTANDFGCNQFEAREVEK